MHIAKFVLPLLLGVSVAACSSWTPSSNLNAQATAAPVTTAQFTATVASSDKFEIAASKMALQKSRDRAVREVARHMIANHAKTTQELKTVVAQNNLPAPPARMTTGLQKQLNELAGSKNFNKDYLDAQETAHADAIKLFEDYQLHGDNAALREFAGNTLPALRAHADMIDDAQQHRARARDRLAAQ